MPLGPWTTPPFPGPPLGPWSPGPLDTWTPPGPLVIPWAPGPPVLSCCLNHRGSCYLHSC